jgi:hypothetical protein
MIRQDIVFSLILGLSPSEAFASLLFKIIKINFDGISAKKSAQILYPAIAKSNICAL